MMKQRIVSKTVEEITEALIDYRGKTPPKTDSGVKLITAKVIKNGRIIDGNHEYIAEENYDSWMRRGLPKMKDVLVTTEAPVGEVAQIRENEKVALAQRVILLRGNPEFIDQDYYFYAMQSPVVQSQLHARSTGTTVLGFKQSELRQVKVPLHPKEIQKKISAILSAYDNLYENNIARLQIYEQILQLIFREWFVLLQYPGNKKYKKVRNGQENIPEGWDIKPIELVAELHRGKSYTSDDLSGDNAVPFFNLKNIQRNGGFRNDGTKLYSGKFKEEQTARTGDILVAVTDMTQERNVIARAARVPKLESDFGVFSMDLVKLEPKKSISASWLYGLLRYSQFPDRVKEYANGANVLHLSPDRIKEYRVVVPPHDLQKQFENIVDPIYSLSDSLVKKNDYLKEMRDLLLPRLISGEIDISELDIERLGEVDGA